QARLRAEQARFANADHLLPSVDAPAGLRARVIAAVRDAIANVRGGEDAGVLATIGAPVRNNAHMWRAACIGFATASVVLGGLYLMVTNQNQKMSMRMEANALSGMIQELGPRAREILMSPQVRPVAFEAASPEANPLVGASLYFDAVTGEALLLCEGLPVADGLYSLVYRDGSGEETLHTILATHGFVPTHIVGLDASQLGSLSIEGPTRRGGASEMILSAGDL
ncbi:MAG: hypothetical protein AAGH64_12975, partial [Planctomycetota bacterium]